MRKFNVSYLWYLGFIGLIGIIYEPFKLFKLFLLFFFSPLIASMLNFVKMPRNQRKKVIDYSKTLVTGMVLNPYLLYQILLHSLGQFLAIRRWNSNLPSPESYQQKTEFFLPFEGFWCVENGGISKKESHSWEVINQRYAYDFVKKDEQGRTYRNNKKKLDDYYAFEKPILSPADGIVVWMRNDIPDSPYTGRINWRTKDFRGNFVIIKHSESEYSFLAHLKQGSIGVKVGDIVKKGQIIGLCGNSGHSTEPHLHFHVQDHPNFFLAVSLPVKFSNFCLKDSNGIKRIKSGYIIKGQQIANNQSNENENVARE